MFASYSVIRRFTPPTCTLEIWAKKPPFWQWQKSQIPKNLRFKLSFDDPRIPKDQQITIKGDRAQLEQLYQAVGSYVKVFLQYPTLRATTKLSSAQTAHSIAHVSQARSETVSSSTSNTKPHLESQGLVSHQLWFSSLAQETAADKIRLSAVQLFDLAMALEAYQTEVAALAQLNSASRNKIIPLWGIVVATIALAGGITALAVKVFNPSPTTTDSVTSEEESAELPIETQPEIVDVIPPKVTENKDKQSNPQPQLSQPLASAEKLPPPPPVDLPKPPPANVPDPAKYPLPELGQIPASPPQPVQPQIANQPESPKPTSSTPATPSANNSESIAVNPQPSTSFQIQTEDTEDDLELPDLPPPQASIPQVETNKLPQTNNSSDLAPTPDLNETNAPPVDIAKSDIAAAPQVKEVKTYFQKQWQPPESLTQTLEYSLLLNTDGSIKRILPLGTASEIYLDRTNIPLMGEAFVSPTTEGKNLTVRLLLSPDGEVTTFLE